MNRAEALILAVALLGLGGSLLVAEQHTDTRRRLVSERRITRGDHTMLAFKNLFFKSSLIALRKQGGAADIAGLALEMNRREPQFRIAYRWGGSVSNHVPGLDCTGFVHGLMYFLGYPEGGRRFNTKALYLKLRRDSRWLTIHDSATNPQPFDPRDLKLGDIIVWPSFVDDGKNLPGPIWGHVGVVTGTGSEMLVTHYVHSDAYDHLDSVGLSGAGINTLPAAEFIRLKQRGVLGVFRRKY